nr:MAG TPA: hypothetical protein [Caudoviricetes sp.]
MISEENTYLIRNILLKYPITRENDMSLYIEYLKENNVEPDNDVLINPELYNLLSFKTVERTRRKLQEIDRDTGEYAIQSTRQMQMIRKQLEKEYKETFRKG